MTRAVQAIGLLLAGAVAVRIAGELVAEAIGPLAGLLGVLALGIWLLKAPGHYRR